MHDKRRSSLFLSPVLTIIIILILNKTLSVTVESLERLKTGTLKWFFFFFCFCFTIRIGMIHTIHGQTLEHSRP